MVRRIKKLGAYVIDFYRCHFALKMAVPMSMLVLVVAVVFQGYLKTQYYDFLYQEVCRTDQVFLETQESTVSDRIYTMTRLGSVFATDASFYREVGEALKSGDEAITLHVITQALSDLTAYDKSIALMAVVNEDDEVFQYCRLNMTNGKSNFWNDDNREMLEDICSQVQKKIEGKLIGDVTNCYVLTPSMTEKQGRPRYLLHMAFPIIGKQVVMIESEREKLFGFEHTYLSLGITAIQDMYIEHGSAIRNLSFMSRMEEWSMLYLEDAHLKNLCELFPKRRKKYPMANRCMGFYHCQVDDFSAMLGKQIFLSELLIWPSEPDPAEKEKWKQAARQAGAGRFRYYVPK